MNNNSTDVALVRVYEFTKSHKQGVSLHPIAALRFSPMFGVVK